MALPSFATPADLAGWDTDVFTPAARERYLRSASILVARAVKNTVYPVDEDGNATDTADIEALRDATVAQVSAWIAAGIDPQAGGTVSLDSSPVRSRQIGTAQIDYDTSASASVQAATQRQQAATQLNDEARSILDLAGLLRAGYTVTG